MIINLLLKISFIKTFFALGRGHERVGYLIVLIVCVYVCVFGGGVIVSCKAV